MPSNDQLRQRRNLNAAGVLERTREINHQQNGRLGIPTTENPFFQPQNETRSVDVNQQISTINQSVDVMSDYDECK